MERINWIKQSAWNSPLDVIAGWVAGASINFRHNNHLVWVALFYRVRRGEKDISFRQKPLDYTHYTFNLSITWYLMLYIMTVQSRLGKKVAWVRFRAKGRLGCFFLLIYLLVHALAFTQGGLSRHHKLSWGTPGSTVLCELTRHFHPVLSPSCVTDDSPSGELFQVCFARGCPCLQLASMSSAPRARRCGMEKVLDQLTFRYLVAWPSLHEQCC